MAVQRQVVVDLVVNLSRWTSGFQRASHDMASATTNMQTKVEALTGRLTLLGVAMVAGPALAVRAWAEFDQAMARVEARGGSAAENIERLSAAARGDEVIQLGYNAVDAANGIDELVKAGVSATDILNGGLSGALSLAAAETMELSESAAIIASALNQFGLHGRDATHVSDLLTAAAGKAQGSAHDLGLAMKQSGLVANQFGWSIEETTGLLAQFASAGLIGSDAGTSVRTMLLHLAAPTIKSQKLMDELGFSVYDTAGEFVSAAELAARLQSAMGGLDEETRNAALAQIFGMDAMRGASLLYDQGAASVLEWQGKVNDSGYAAEVAAKRMDSLNGDLKKLASTWQNFLIEMGSSADTPLRGMVQGFTDLLQMLRDMPPVAQKALMLIAGGGGLLVLGTIATAQMVSAVRTLGEAFAATGAISATGMGRIATATGKVTKALGVLSLVVLALQAGSGLSDWMNGDTAGIDATADALDRLSSVGSKALDSLFKVEGWKSAFAEVDSLSSAIERLVNPTMMDRLDDFAGEVLSLGSSEGSADRTRVIEQFGEMDSVLAEMISGGKAQAASEMFREISDAWVAGGGSLEDLQALLPQYVQGIKDVATVSDEAAAGTGAIAEATGEATSAIDEQNDAIEKNIELWRELTGVARGVDEANAAYEQSVDDATETIKAAREDTKKYGEVLKSNQTSLDLTTQAGRDAQDALLDLTESAMDQTEALQADGASAEELAAKMKVAREEFVRQAEAAGLTKEAAEALATAYGLVPKTVATLLTVETETAEEKVASLLDDITRAEGTVIINGNPALGLDKLEGLEAVIDEATGTMTIQAQDGSALTTLNDYKTTVDKTTGAVTITGKDARGREVVATLTSWTSRQTGTINVNANTASAREEVASLQRYIDSIKDKTVTMRVVTKSDGSVHGVQTKGGIITKASGGAVSGPGGPTDDEIPALLSNGEHVWTAAEVAAVGGHSALYRLRSQARAGMLHFATGGAVGQAESSVRAWRARVKRENQRVAALEHQLDVARARDQDARAKSLDKQLDRARDQQSDANDRLSKEESRLARLREQRSSTKTDIRRGQVWQGAAGSLSGAYGLVDEMRDVAGDSRGKTRASLLDTAYRAEINMRRLYTQAENLEKSLEKARDRVADLASIKADVGSALAGGFALGEVKGTLNQWNGEYAAPTGSQMLGAAQSYAAKVKKFGGKLSALQKKGFSGVILQEIAGMGVDAGMAAADALLSLSATDMKAMNTAYSDIEKWSQFAGEAVTGGFYKGGLAAAQGIVKGLESEQKAVEAAIEKMAKGMESALKRALGIKSPSRVFRSLMNYVGEGSVLGLEDQRARVSAAAADLLSAAAGQYANTSPIMVPASTGATALASAVTGLQASQGVTKADLVDLASMIVKGFETGSVRHLKNYTQRQNLNLARARGIGG